ncbi:MAG TPA: hypothetical protein VFS49_08315 [Croceibacterium sp.]|nr:hypothetical protein [Croceibacterium sp.]
MDCADWRPYRSHLIIARRGGLLGRRLWDVWHRGSLVGTFGDLVRAELHVDARLRAHPPGGT